MTILPVASNSLCTCIQQNSDDDDDDDGGDNDNQDDDPQKGNIWAVWKKKFKWIKESCGQDDKFLPSSIKFEIKYITVKKEIYK